MTAPVPTAIVQIAWKDDNQIMQDLHTKLMECRYIDLHGVPVRLWEHLKVPEDVRAQFHNTAVDMQAFPKEALEPDFIPLSGHPTTGRARERAFDLAVDEERVLALVRQVRHAPR